MLTEQELEGWFGGFSNDYQGLQGMTSETGGMQRLHSAAAPRECGTRKARMIAMFMPDTKEIILRRLSFLYYIEWIVYSVSIRIILLLLESV